MGLYYAFSVVRETILFRLQTFGIFHQNKYAHQVENYQDKSNFFSTHSLAVSEIEKDFDEAIKVLQQGIGFWCSGEGKAELVSVFTYYCHIGYLCTDGGKVRATNGNNSYGDFGSVAIGFDQTESPITGKVDNYSKEATISQVYNDENQLFTVGYNNAGNHYTNGTVTITGSGQNAAAKITEFRDNGIMEVRVLDPGDSSIAGGAGYTL